MILKKIRLHPFAGEIDREFDFKGGLNVVQGPNEFGKSTLFRAFMHGLHTRVNLPPARLISTLSHVFPKRGGDVIRVTIEFEDENGGAYTLEKEWSTANHTNNRAKLKSPNGTEVTDSDEVQRQIEQHLGMSTATMRSILLADQGGLQEILAKYDEKRELRTQLGDILTQTVMQTGGVSIDALKEKAQRELAEYSGRWDWEHEYPKDGKGIQQPWKAGVGTILEAFYTSEKARLEYEGADRYERDMDVANGRLETLQVELKPIGEEHGRLEPLRDSVHRREILDRDVTDATREIAKTKADFEAWVASDTNIPTLDGLIQEVDRKLKALEDEHNRALAHEQVTLLDNRMQLIDRLQQAVSKAKKHLDDLTPITQEQIDQLRLLNQRIRTLETKVEAAKILVKIEVKADETVTISSSGYEPEVMTLSAGNGIERALTGAAMLETSSIRLNMVPGDGDLFETIRDLEALRIEFSNLLSDFNVASLEEAEAMVKQLSAKQIEHSNAQSRLADELKGDSIDDLKAQLAALKAQAGLMVRDKDTLASEKGKLALEKQRHEGERVALGAQIEGWTKAHGSKEQLINKLTELTLKSNVLESELSKLPRLPQEFQNSAEFSSRLNDLALTKQRLKGQIQDQRDALIRLNASVPQQTAEEAKLAWETAKADFERTLHRGKLIRKIAQEIESLEQGMGANRYAELESRFVHWAGVLTQGRFKKIDMNGDSPDVFGLEDNLSIPFELLSHGTRDTVSLAWRFAVAEQFLGERCGFVVLDDPMVDMDPNRRKLATDAIREFADRHQVIVMTCHPEHERGWWDA